MPLLLLLVPETQQYRVLTGLQKTDPAAAVKEQEAILSEKPVFHAPWMPLRSVRHSHQLLAATRYEVSVYVLSILVRHGTGCCE